MLAFVDDVVDELGSREEVERVNWILENGTGADRQLRVYEETGGDLEEGRRLHLRRNEPRPRPRPARRRTRPALNERTTENSGKWKT